MSAVNKGYPEEGQLYAQTAPKGFIFLHPALKRYQEILEILLQMQPLPIFSSLIWPAISSIRIKQTSKSTNSLSLSTSDSDHYLLGRHADNREVNKGDTELQEYSDFLVTGVGFRNKSKVSYDTQ